MTVIRKTNRLARKSIIVYAHKKSFKRTDANGKEARFTLRQSVELASNLDGGIFARRKR